MTCGVVRYNPHGGLLGRRGNFCAPWTEFSMDLDQTKLTGSIYDALLRFYPIVEALGSKVGRWCTEM
jgi:hypothetical protein